MRPITALLHTHTTHKIYACTQSHENATAREKTNGARYMPIIALSQTPCYTRYTHRRRTRTRNATGTRTRHAHRRQCDTLRQTPAPHTHIYNSHTQMQTGRELGTVCAHAACAHAATHAAPSHIHTLPPHTCPHTLAHTLAHTHTPAHHMKLQTAREQGTGAICDRLYQSPQKNT